jgi:hypothetical protein
MSNKRKQFIKNLFKNFYDAYTASNSSTHEKAAEQIFQNVVKTARNARDRALAIPQNENLFCSWCGHTDRDQIIISQGRPTSSIK